MTIANFSQKADFSKGGYLYEKGIQGDSSNTL
jgi:hypothetical protein